MHCLYCRVHLAPLRRLDDGDFCSDEHRLIYTAEHYSVDYLILPNPPDSAPCLPLQPIAYPRETCSTSPLIRPTLDSPPPERALPATGLVPCSLMPPPAVPPAPAISLSAKALTPRPTLLRPALRLRTAVSRSAAQRGWAGYSPSKLSVTRRWTIPLGSLVLLASLHWLNGGNHTASVAAAPAASAPIIKKIQDSLHQRAAVFFADDFRAGLDDWSSRTRLTDNWGYDESGFVRPSGLAIYRPTMGLTDYHIQFLAQIDRYPVGLAYRIEDWNHYYALKLAAQGSPLPGVNLIRYSVVGGKDVGVVTRRLALSPLRDSLFRVQLNVHGSDFTLIMQGQIADYWSDGRYGKGGVGFFGGKGGRARLRWVEVTHQYDALGRLCAFFAPNDGHINNGSRNKP